MIIFENDLYRVSELIQPDGTRYVDTYVRPDVAHAWIGTPGATKDDRPGRVPRSRLTVRPVPLVAQS